MWDTSCKLAKIIFFFITIWNVVNYALKSDYKLKQNIRFYRLLTRIDGWLTSSISYYFSYNLNSCLSVIIIATRHTILFDAYVCVLTCLD